MKKHLIVIGIVVLLMIVGFCGCNEINPFSGDDRLVGTWESEKEGSGTITFFSDGEGSQLSELFQWEIKDGKLVLEAYQGGVSVVYNYQFSDNDTTLALNYVSSPITYIYTKQQ